MARGQLFQYNSVFIGAWTICLVEAQNIGASRIHLSITLYNKEIPPISRIYQETVIEGVVQSYGEFSDRQSGFDKMAALNRIAGIGSVMNVIKRRRLVGLT